MRLLILSSEFPPGPGGIGTHAYQISKQFFENKHQVCVITPQNYAELDEILEFNQQQGFPIVSLHPPKISIADVVYRSSIIFKQIKHFSPDIILATGAKSVWLLAVINHIAKIPWVGIGHGTEFGQPLNWEKRITRWAFNQADGVICVSNFTNKVMLELGILPKSSWVIPNGADDKVFFPDANRNSRFIFQKFGINSENKYFLLTVGNVTPRKGQEVVISAMPMILSEFPNAEYLMVGLPTDKDRLETLSKKLGVQDHIHFIGKCTQEELRSFYQNCDIFVMTSRKLADGDFEGFGISVIEAALCQKPAIVSAGSGLEEAVVNGLTGICVPENDADKTAWAVIKLLRDTELRSAMSNHAYIRAKQSFTWKIIGQKYITIFQQIVDANKNI